MKYKTEWDLSLLYKNDKDPQIEKDIKKLETLCAAFEKKYKGKDFVSTTKKLLEVLKEYELLVSVADNKGLIYFYLKRDIDTANTEIAAKESVLEQRVQKAINKIIFFELTIALIPKEKRRHYLQDISLAHFSYFLTKIFDNAKYNLSENEEKLLGLLSQTSNSMWVDTNKKLITEQSVSYKGTSIPISEATEIIRDLPKGERGDLAKKINSTMKSISFMAEAELNAIVNFKKVIDDEKGYKNPCTSTILRYENDEKEILTLVKTVKKYFFLSHKYYKLQAKFLGEKKITPADLYVQLGEIKKKFNFETTVSIVKDGFTKFGPEYAAILEKYLINGQIDVFPRKDKNGGAHCISSGKLPVYVGMNFVDNVKSVGTLAHEMGHAFHAELNKKNSPLYQSYTTSVAEVASTFFENFAADELEQYLSDEEKMIFLHQKIGNDIAGIIRQIACFNFETELHECIRKKGKLSKEEIAKLMNKHMSAYMGEAVTLTDDDGYLFVRWSHIRSFFYVYSYAYGYLISKVLYEKWKANKSYKTKVEQFLSAGGSMSPKDIFKSIGINTNEAFFETGLKGIEADINKLEKLAKKYKKI